MKGKINKKIPLTGLKEKTTAKQNKFCLEYLKDFNATKAAERAGYSKKTAYSIGERLLRNVEIKKRVDEKIKKQANKTEVKISDIIKGFKDVAFGNEKTSDKLKALELLGKYLGMFDKNLKLPNINIEIITNLEIKPLTKEKENEDE